MCHCDCAFRVDLRGDGDTRCRIDEAALEQVLLEVASRANDDACQYANDAVPRDVDACGVSTAIRVGTRNSATSAPGACSGGSCPWNARLPRDLIAATS